MSDDNFVIYKVNSVRKSPEVSILPPFVALRKKRNKQREKEEKRKRNSFKEDFLKRFKLDQKYFSVNLIKKNGQWFIEVYNKKTMKSIYQDYDTVCNILDIRCKLPKIVGANVDKTV